MSGVIVWAITGVLGLAQLRVAINIPAYRLDLFVADSVARSMPVAVGMPNYPSPRGSFEITSIEWNPWWIPPDRPWAAHERKTPPGPANPMGRVKLNFRPLYFLHGSPAERSIGSAASHGCIRMLNHDAIELARIVHQYGSPALTALDVDALASDTVTTRLVDLDRPVRLDIGYDVVELRGAYLFVYRDVYHLTTRPARDEIYAVLAARGIDTALVDAGRVSALVKRIPPNGNRIALDSLVRGQPSKLLRHGGETP